LLYASNKVNPKETPPVTILLFNSMVAGASPTPSKESEVASPNLTTKDDVNNRAIHFKEEGNVFFSQKEYEKAVTAYRLGLALYCKDSNVELEVALRSNLAMALLKIEEYRDALNECSIGIALDTSAPKLWYRRALAHEGMQDWTKAIEDLEECLQLFDASDLSKAQERMKKAAIEARERINQTKSIVTKTKTQHHDVFIQKETVITLLKARCEALKPSLTKKDEAFFLLEWNWWQQWCKTVGLFDGDDNGFILSLLAPGAISLFRSSNLPQNDGGDDDDMDVDVDMELDLGPIDNSRLLISRDTPFTMHWYHADQELAPNLVRGYDYEIIPREVYQALSTWYGETTVPICRRTSSDNILQLYQDSNYGGKSITSLRNMSQVQNQQNRGPLCGACHAPNAKARCKQCLVIYYCNRSCQESHWPYHKHLCSKAAMEKNNNNSRQLRHSVHSRLGRVGLHNLGNTCFMNSALQCLSHATPLTRHFLSQAFLQDLNPHNPLGTRGKLAHAYDQVLRELYMGSSLAMSPTTLKVAIARFAPRFAGCSQHDATEFLAYLLDGLHEDLNRIRKAPYVELPDIDDRSDMSIAGAEAWNGHLRRNDSLVLQTFYGQFKSTCVCPQCNRVSVSFDAFNHVSLEIPQPQTNRFLPILVFGGQNSGPPVRWMIQVRRGCFVTDIRQALSKQCGIPFQRLALCDVYDFNIYEILQDSKNVNAIRTSDVLAAYNVDPYTNTTIHVIITNSCQFSKGNEEKKSPRANEEGNNEDLFGFPLLTSFKASLTCKEVYQHLWEQFHYVEGIRKEWMQICITDNNGKALALFPGESSILPSDSGEKIVNFLGKDCTERFLFCTIQWKMNNGAATSFDKSAFVKVIDHESYIQGIQQELKVRSGVTLDQCFQTFTRPERLDENNMWYCNQCKKHVRALKTMELWRLPNVLVVHLKRFEFKHALRRDKLDTFVDFPLDGLDMSQYCGKSMDNEKSFVQDDTCAMYDLFAVTNHFGRLGFGHYTAFARSWDESGMGRDGWALFDDSSVRREVETNIVTPAAYVLFYRRRAFN